VKVVLILVQVVGLAAFAESWVMLAYGPMALSLGIALAALGLDGICGALMPRWERPWWKPPGSRPPTVRVGRLSSFGFGIMFGAVGMSFLGYGSLPGPAILALVGAFLVGCALALVGGKYDSRRAKEGRATEQVPQGGGVCSSATPRPGARLTTIRVIVVMFCLAGALVLSALWSRTLGLVYTATRPLPERSNDSRP
jgi:hypothetical protein